jgi:GT2 family glycosyltransferase
MDFSVIVATYKREEELRKCIDSIFNQKFPPSELLIVDDGELAKDFISEVEGGTEGKKIRFAYYKKDHTKERRGLSESKNIAVNLVNNEVFFILDDDLVLDNDFFEKIMKVWQDNEDNNLIGVGGIIKNNRKKSKLEKIYNKIFGLTSSKHKWDINNVGVQVWDEGINKREKGYYAHGGVCSYRKTLVEKLGGFSVFSGGRTALEDIDFCLRTKNKGYYFIVEPKAKVFHNHKSVKQESQFLMGFKESYNRKIIFKNNCQKTFKNYLWFYWANIGWILRQFLAGNFRKGLGMIKGLFSSIK